MNGKRHAGAGFVRLSATTAPPPPSATSHYSSLIRFPYVSNDLRSSAINAGDFKTYDLDLNTNTTVVDQPPAKKLIKIDHQALTGFSRLPGLRSYESVPRALPIVPSLIVGSSSGSSSSLPSDDAVTMAVASPRQQDGQRRRRQLISDRTKILEKLMPWEKRMDTATMLEEARKYVRFLEAQVAALKGMPAAAAFSAAPVSSGRADGLAGLERLNRQQMLQVMVTSPRMQHRLCVEELCVVSMEQAVALRRRNDAERRKGTAVAMVADGN